MDEKNSNLAKMETSFKKTNKVEQEEISLLAHENVREDSLASHLQLQVMEENDCKQNRRHAQNNRLKPACCDFTRSLSAGVHSLLSAHCSHQGSTSKPT